MFWLKLEINVYNNGFYHVDNKIEFINHEYKDVKFLSYKSIKKHLWVCYHSDDFYRLHSDIICIFNLDENESYFISMQLKFTQL